MPGYHLSGADDKARKGAHKAAAQTKTCTRCHQPKPRSQFSKHRKDTITSWCRPCNNAYQRELNEQKRQEMRGVKELDLDRRLQSLAPTEDEMAAIIKAAARSGLTDPTPDDVLSELYGIDEWIGFRPGVASVVTLMAERSA